MWGTMDLVVGVGVTLLFLLALLFDVFWLVLVYLRRATPCVRALNMRFVYIEGAATLLHLVVEIARFWFVLLWLGDYRNVPSERLPDDLKLWCTVLNTASSFLFSVEIAGGLARLAQLIYIFRSAHAADSARNSVRAFWAMFFGMLAVWAAVRAVYVLSRYVIPPVVYLYFYIANFVLYFVLCALLSLYTWRVVRIRQQYHDGALFVAGILAYTVLSLGFTVMRVFVDSWDLPRACLNFFFTLCINMIVYGMFLVAPVITWRRFVDTEPDKQSEVSWACDGTQPPAVLSRARWLLAFVMGSTLAHGAARAKPLDLNECPSLTIVATERSSDV